MWYLRIIVIVITLLLLPCTKITFGNQELNSYITVLNEEGTQILQTGLEVRVGDEYISENTSLIAIYHTHTLFLSTGSFGEIKRKVHTFSHYEFTNFFSKIRPKKK